MLHLIFAAIAAGESSSPLTAQAVYARALARLHAIPQSPYLMYVMTQQNRGANGAGSLDLTEIVIERRSDRVSFNTVQGGDEPSDSVIIGVHYIIPDMFLSTAIPPPPDAIGAVPQLDEIAPQTGAMSLKTITTVTAVAHPAYDVTAKMGPSGLATENLAGCGPAYHLYLRPVRNLERYNVHELWVRANDFVLCQARYSSKFFEAKNVVNTDASLEVTATLGDDGLVKSWADSGRIHIPVPGFSTVGSGTFSRFTWKDQMPEYFFDQKLWEAHVRAAHAAPAPSPSA